MVLYSIVSPSLEDLCDLSPLIAEFSVLKVKYPFFFFSPGCLLNFRVQVVMPPLPALLANAAWQVLSDEGPLLWPVLFHKMKDQAVFFFSPRSLHEIWI